MGRERNFYQGGGQRSKRREEGLYQRGTDINISKTGTELSIHKMWSSWNTSSPAYRTCAKHDKTDQKDVQKMIPQKVRNRTESGVKCDIYGKG